MVRPDYKRLYEEQVMRTINPPIIYSDDLRPRTKVKWTWLERLYLKYFKRVEEVWYYEA